MPARYLKGHGNRIVPVIEDATPFKIDGTYCRLVWLKDTFYTIVNDFDYEKTMQFHWSPFCPGGNTYYVTRNLYTGKDSSPKMIYLHDFLMDPPEGMLVDHRNRNGLDNRREGKPHGNLRFATPAQNVANSIGRGGVSGYKGAFPTANGRRWAAIANVNGKRTYLGTYDSPLEAHLVYMEKMIEMHGDFARATL